MTASTQITDTKIFAFIAILVFSLLSHKVLFINGKDDRNCLKLLFREVNHVRLH